MVLFLFIYIAVRVYKNHSTEYYERVLCLPIREKNKYQQITI